MTKLCECHRHEWMGLEVSVFLARKKLENNK